MIAGFGQEAGVHGHVVSSLDKLNQSHSLITPCQCLWSTQLETLHRLGLRQENKSSQDALLARGLHMIRVFGDLHS